MLKSKKILFLIYGLLINISSFSQVQINSDLFYSAFISGEVGAWDKYLERLYGVNNPSDSVILTQLEYTFGIIGWHNKDGNIERAKYWNKRFNNLLESQRVKDIQSPDIEVYDNAYLCYYIILEKKHRVSYGYKAFNNTERLVKEYPNNVIARVLMGNIYFNTPSLFGGSKTKATDSFKAALKIIKNKNDEKHNWLYIYSILRLAEIYHSELNLKEYDFYINKLQKEEPSISPNVINSINGGK